MNFRSQIEQISHSRNVRIAAALAVFILFIYIVYHIYVWTVTQSTDNAYIDSLITEVSAEVDGSITKILVIENQRVEAGQEIAYIDDKIYNANFTKSVSMLLKAAKNIEIIKYKIKLAEIAKDKAGLDLSLAQDNLRIVEQDYKRSKELTKDNYSSQRTLDFAQLNFLESRTKLQNAILAVETSENNLELLQNELLIARAEHEAAIADNILAENNLHHTIIYSPVSGIMTNSILRVGNLVHPGRTQFMVVPDDKMYIKANYKETQISKFRENMLVDIEVDAAKGVKLEGKIRNLFPATGSKFSLIPPQNATGNFTKIVQRVPVIIDFEVPENYKSIIVPGMSCTVKIRTDK